MLLLILKISKLHKIGFREIIHTIDDTTSCCGTPHLKKKKQCGYVLVIFVEIFNVIANKIST